MRQSDQRHLTCLEMSALTEYQHGRAAMSRKLELRTQGTVGGKRGTIPISLRGVILWSVLETLGETKSLIVWKKTGKKRNMYLWSWFWSISFFLVRLFVTYDCDVEAKCLISGEEAVYHPVAFLLQVGNVRRSTWFNAITLSLPFSDTAFIIL